MVAAHFGASEIDGGNSEWVRAHEALSRLARQRAAADIEEGRFMLAALRSAAHVHLGFGSFGEYIERLFGYKPRSTQEKLRVAEALEALPLISRALEEGAIHWSAARELTRVAVAETEAEWLEVARGKTLHQLEALVAGKGPGDEPSADNKPSARRHVLRFEVSPETLALFREAMSRLRRQSGSSLDDDAALLLMARHVLGGPGDDGRSSYQVALSVCPECGQGSQLGAGELVPVGTEVVELADCDGQQLPELAAPAKESAAASDQSTAPDQSAHTGAGDAGTKRQPEVPSRSRAHTGARAKQTIPPATRRAVLLRDHRRCVVPGCKNVQFLDLHHIVPRSEGGDNDPDNLVTCCGAHHRAAHRGKLVVKGRVSTCLQFFHADGSKYGQAPEPRWVELQAKAFAALRRLGFREGETQRALAEVCKTRGERQIDLETILRDALARLTPQLAR